LTLILLLAAALLGSLHIRADYRQQWSLTYVLKPLTMLAIIGLVVSSGVGEMGFYRLAVTAGLVLSLIGDVFLMLRPSRFLAGLSAFLLAHIVYVTAFFSRVEAFHPLALGLPAFAGLAMFMLIRRGAGRIALPIGIYILAIAGMVGTSLSAAIDQPDAGRLAAAAGALLFLFSDATIGVVRFHTRFDLGQALILGSYYPAQALIALSAGALFA
jgi:uncharacterized membrane protein YhhN